MATYALAFALDSLPMAFPLLVATVWVGVRFATLLSVLHSFAVGTATIVLTLAGIGPFAQLANEEVGILLAQFFLAMLLVSGLLLATGRDERVQLADELAKAREEAVYQAGLLDTVITSMAEGIAVIDDDRRDPDAQPGRRPGARLRRGDRADARSTGSTNLFIDGQPLTRRPSGPAAGRSRARCCTTSQVELRAPGEDRVLSISAAPLPRDPEQTAPARCC